VKRWAWAAAAGLVLASCAPAEESGGASSPDRVTTRWSESFYRENQIRLSDGRSVTCIELDGFREAALSCDWDHAIEVIPNGS